MKKVPALIAICLTLALAGFAQSNSAEKIPQVSLKDLKGKTVRLSDFKGKVVVLDFWATWCAPCLSEIPELIKWQKEYENQGLQIVGIAYPPTNRAKVRSFARRNKINYPILFGSKKTRELFDSEDTMPLTVIIDKDGSITGPIEGIIFADEFDEKIKPLLQSDSEKKTDNPLNKSR